MGPDVLERGRLYGGWLYWLLHGLHLAVYYGRRVQDGVLLGVHGSLLGCLGMKMG